MLLKYFYVWNIIINFYAAFSKTKLLADVSENGDGNRHRAAADIQNGYDRMALFASCATTTAFLFAAADAQNMYKHSTSSFISFHDVHAERFPSPFFVIKINIIYLKIVKKNMGKWERGTKSAIDICNVCDVMYMKIYITIYIENI